MITEVIMKRDILGGKISQKSKSEFFSATDLEEIGNDWRKANDLPKFDMNSFFNNKATKEFIEEIEKKYGVKARITSKGKGHHTWIHPLLFIDMALAISPTLKVEVYEWIFDNLLKFRNDSGDSYREMSGALFTRCTNKSEFPRYIIKVANAIQIACDVSDWQTATKEQLELRDKIHDSIKLLARVMKGSEPIVRIAIEEHTTLKRIK